MSSRFLLRPASIGGESLSSWRQRCGWANGYRLFPMPDQRTRRVDPDVGLREGELQWLAHAHEVTEKSVRAMTLRGLTALSTTQVQSRHHAAWWLPARYGREQAQSAAMFCPLCLMHDREPHYRLVWRLAFNYGCPEHAVLMRESCEKCGAPPWPAGCGVADRIATQFTSFRYCWRCGEAHGCDATEAATQNNSTTDWLTNGRAQLGDTLVPSQEAFAALRALCQLFVRKDTRTLIETGSGPWALIARSVERAEELRSIELGSVRIRAAIVPASLDLLARWPHAFLDFAADVGLSRMHFHPSYSWLPGWFNDCLRQKLARQNRWVTPSMVRHAARELEQAGGRPTKMAIRRHLHWHGEIPDEVLLGPDPA